MKRNAFVSNYMKSWFVILADQLHNRNMSIKEGIKILEGDLILSNTKLRKFSNGAQKIGKLLSLSKSFNNKSGLSYIDKESHASSTSQAPAVNMGKTTFVPTYSEGKEVEGKVAHNPDKDKKKTHVFI